MKRLGNDAQQVQPLFVSVDPRRDTPEVLQSYLAYFDASIIGLTGSIEALHRITREYGTYFTYRGDIASGRYEVQHSGNIYLIGKDGQLRRILPYGMPLSQLLESVQSLLRQQLPAQ